MKSKRILGIIIALAVVFNSVMISSAENVTPDLVISTADDLKSFRDSVNEGDNFSGKYVLLENDIDLDNELWVPIGLDGDGAGFMGTFDGGNKTISNLYVDSRNDGYDNAAGLFGSLRGTVRNLNVSGAKVYNLVTQDPTVDGTAVIAGCTGYGATIDTVYVENATVVSNRYVGGVSGFAAGTFKNCTLKNISLSAVPNMLSNGTYDNGDKLGGIVGYINSEGVTTIENCKLTGDNTLTAYRDAGGIVGKVLNTSVIQNNVVEGTLKMVTDLSVLEPQANHNIGIIIGRDTAAVDDGNDTENVDVITKVKEDVGAEYEVGVGKEYSTLAEAIAAAKANGEAAVIYNLFGENALETGYSHGIVDFGAEKVTVAGTDNTAKLTITGGGVPDIKGITIKNIIFADEGAYLPTHNEFMYQNFADCAFVNVTFEEGIRISGKTTLDGCTITAAKAEQYALWLDNGEFSVTSTDIVADGGYGLVKSDVAGATFNIQDSTLEYKGISTGKKEALNTNGLIINANGNTFKNCEEGIMPADKLNTVNGNENVCDDVLISEKNNVVLYAAKVGDAHYYSLTEAINDAKPVGVVTIVNDTTLSETVTLGESDNITIDLAGNVVTGLDTAESGSFNLINNLKGTLTIKDSSEAGTGKITLQAETDRNWSGKSAIIDNRGGVLNIEGGALAHLGGTDMAYVVDTNANWYGDAVTNITGGTLNSAYISVRLYMSSAEATNNSSGKAVVNVSGGNTGGSLYAIWAQAPEGNMGQTGEINITGGVVGGIFTDCTDKAVIDTKVLGGTVGNIIAEKGELKINGGIVNGELFIYEDDGETVADEDEIIISGSFSARPSEKYLADKSIILDTQKDGYYLVKVESTLEFVVNPSDAVSKGDSVTVSVVANGLSAYNATELDLSISLPREAIDNASSPFAVNYRAGSGIRNALNNIYYDEESCKMKIHSTAIDSQNPFSDSCEVVLLTFTVDNQTMLDKMIFGTEEDKADCVLKSSDGIQANIASVSKEVKIVENVVVAARAAQKQYIKDYISNATGSSAYTEESLKDIEIYHLIATLKIDAALTVEEINEAVAEAIAKIAAVPTVADGIEAALKKISTKGKEIYDIDDIIETGAKDVDVSKSEFYKASIEEYKKNENIPGENATPNIITDVQMQEIINLTNNILAGTADGYITQRGDFNMSGVVDIQDPSGAMRYICGLPVTAYSIGAQNLLNADLHTPGDGVITVFDVVEIMVQMMNETVIQ